MKKLYIEPEIEVIKLTFTNVLNTSAKENAVDGIYTDTDDFGNGDSFYWHD